MGTLLVINPNTSAEVSALLQRCAQARAPAGVDVQVVTARFGARYITGERAAAIAGHAAMDAYAAWVAARGRPAAVLLGCFGDPGLFALRALCPLPVLGLAEAAMQAAALRGPFVVVTGGAAWAAMLQRLAGALALPAPLLGVQTVDRSGGEMAADPAMARQLLAAACREALARWPSAQAVLLGGAGLVGLAEGLAPDLPVPVLDNVHLALDAAFAAVLTPQASRFDAAPESGPWVGLTPELSLLLAAPTATLP